MLELDCTCLDDDLWRCINGDVYGPCGSENCYGICELEGKCTCVAKTHEPGTHGEADD